MPALPLTSPTRLAAFLAAAGTAHFLVPQFYDSLVPTSLPGSARTWTLASGVVEIAVGAAVAHPRTRRLGALAAAGLFVAVFPGNVKAAAEAQPGTERALTYGRLPLQVPLVLWALSVRRAAGRAAA